MYKSFIIPIIACLSGLMSACGTMLPAQEMSNARQTLQTAKSAGAEIYATDIYSRAQVTLDTAANHLNSGNFYQARQLALQATEEAKQAHMVALNNRKK